MSEPAKLTILRGLTDALKSITPDNGFVSDLSDFDPGDGVFTPRVYRGRAMFGESDPVPMLSVLEGIDSAEYVAEALPTTPFSEYWWPLIVQGWVKDDPENPTDPAYLLLADVRKRLAVEAKRKTTDRTDPMIFGLSCNLVRGLRFNTGIVRPANEISMYAGFHMIVEVLITDNAETPYV